jgi:hypothetical protein
VLTFLVRRPLLPKLERAATPNFSFKTSNFRPSLQENIPHCPFFVFISVAQSIETMARPLREKDKDKVQNISANHVRNNSWDDWVPQDRVRKFTPENKELAAQLHNQMKLLQQKAPKSVGKGPGKRGQNGSDFSSRNDSEELGGSVAAAPGRGGPRRNRDYDLEHVSNFLFFIFCLKSFGSGYCGEDSSCMHLRATHHLPYWGWSPHWTAMASLTSLWH